MTGACMAGGMHGGGMHGGGCAWQGACVAGGCAWQGACMVGVSMPQQILWDTVNEQAVCILLECILVSVGFRCVDKLVFHF